jgi:hypothetical protein
MGQYLIKLSKVYCPARIGVRAGLFGHDKWAARAVQATATLLSFVKHLKCGLTKLANEMNNHKRFFTTRSVYWISPGAQYLIDLAVVHHTFREGRLGSFGRGLF